MLGRIALCIMFGLNIGFRFIRQNGLKITLLRVLASGLTNNLTFFKQVADNIGVESKEAFDKLPKMEL